MVLAEIERVGVVGCGLMGAGIAEVTARAGRSVTVVEMDMRAIERGRDRFEGSLRRAVRSGKLTEHDAEETLGRVTFALE